MCMICQQRQAAADDHASLAAAGGTAGAAAASARSTVFTTAQIANQLTNVYWGGSSRAFDIPAGGLLNVDISGLTAAGRELALLALEAWTTQTGLRFDTAPGRGATIHIRFDDEAAGAYATYVYSGSTLRSSVVNVSTRWLADNGTGFNSYSLQSYIHEIGHALGLGHAGNYDGSATYGADNSYANDSWQASVMSYFDQTDNTFIDASRAYVVAPMNADILAIRSLYGIPADLRSGNTTYGDNSDAGGTYERISTLRAAGTLGGEVTLTILDQGGFDTLDLRSSRAAQVVDLRPGGISDTYGLRGNLVIAEDTLLEQVLTGAGNDSLLGNDADNVLQSGQGADTIAGGVGNDFLAGGEGNDTIYGEDGNDTIYLGFGNDFAGGGAGDDLLYGGAGSNRIFGGLGRDTVYGGTGGDDISGGGAGVNQLYGNDGNDTITAGTSGDLLAGGNGNDTLYGGVGNDTIFCGLGDDFVGGGEGNDRITAGAGANRIFGGVGNDTVVAGTGRDVITGGSGADVFIFASAAAAGIGAARDVITDFTAGVDDIDLSALGLTFTLAGAFAGGGARQVRSIAGFVVSDANGDGVADFAIEITGGLTLGAGDFLF